MPNLYRPLTAMTLWTGNNTAYSAPSGTAVMVQYIYISTNISATAGGNYTAQIRVGPSGALIQYQNPTAITGGGVMRFTAPVVLESANWYVVISASTGSGLDVLMGGLRMN